MSKRPLGVLRHWPSLRGVSFTSPRELAGLENLRAVVTDLMDKRPTTVEDQVDPLPARVENELRKQNWVRDVRAREEGHVYFGEVFVVPSTEQNLLGNIEQVHQDLRDMDWRLHDVVVTPTRSLEDEDEPSSER